MLTILFDLTYNCFGMVYGITKYGEGGELPEHHFMKLFLAASPASSIAGSASRELMPAYLDWIRHKVNPGDNPTRKVKLQKGVLKRIAKGGLIGLPTAMATGLVSGALLDAYLKKKLQGEDNE